MNSAPTLLNLLSAGNIIIFMLVLTRVSGLIITAPFFSTINAPILAKIWFCATVAFLMYPVVFVSKAYIAPHNMPEFIILLAIEFFVGALIGFIANLLIEGVRMCGNIISIQMGLSMSEALDPATGVSSPEISRFYVYLTVIIFLMTGAYQSMFIALFDSFKAVPMGLLPIFEPQMIKAILVLFGQLFKIAFGLALPIYSVLLISDMLLGIMSKTMPQMNIYMVALPIKMYIGFFLILGFLSLTSSYLGGVIENYMQAIGLLFS